MVRMVGRARVAMMGLVMDGDGDGSDDEGDLYTW